MESIRVGIISALAVAVVCLFAFDVQAQGNPIKSFGYPNVKAEFCKAKFGIFTDTEMEIGHEWLVAKAMSDFGIDRATAEGFMEEGAAEMVAAMERAPERMTAERCADLHKSFTANVMSQSKGDRPWFEDRATPVADSDTICGKRDEIVARLESGYQEFSTAMGMASSGALVELFTSEDGSWTMMLSQPNGVSCLIAAGEGWESFSAVKPKGTNA